MRALEREFKRTQESSKKKQIGLNRKLNNP